MFIGRKKEIFDLNKRYESGRFEFAVIYGRRRVGKTCHHVEDIPLYDLRSDPRTAELAGPQLAQADYLTFASAGGVRQFIQAYGAIPQQAVCVCIGEVTGEALRQVYQKPFLTAPEISAHGILSAILEHAAHASGR